MNWWGANWYKSNWWASNWFIGVGTPSGHGASNQVGGKRKHRPPGPEYWQALAELERAERRRSAVRKIAEVTRDAFVRRAWAEMQWQVRTEHYVQQEQKRKALAAAVVVLAEL